jgi:hypothetical protein
MTCDIGCRSTFVGPRAGGDRVLLPMRFGLPGRGHRPRERCDVRQHCSRPKRLLTTELGRLGFSSRSVIGFGFRAQVDPASRDSCNTLLASPSTASPVVGQPSGRGAFGNCNSSVAYSGGRGRPRLRRNPPRRPISRRGRIGSWSRCHDAHSGLERPTGGGRPRAVRRSYGRSRGENGAGIVPLGCRYRHLERSTPRRMGLRSDARGSSRPLLLRVQPVGLSVADPK